MFGGQIRWEEIASGSVLYLLIGVSMGRLEAGTAVAQRPPRSARTPLPHRALVSADNQITVRQRKYSVRHESPLFIRCINNFVGLKYLFEESTAVIYNSPGN